MESTNKNNRIPENKDTRQSGELNKEIFHDEEAPSGIRGGGTSPEAFIEDTTIEISSAGDVAVLNDEDVMDKSTPESEVDPNSNQRATLNRDENQDPGI